MRPGGPLEDALEPAGGMLLELLTAPAAAAIAALAPEPAAGWACADLGRRGLAGLAAAAGAGTLRVVSPEEDLLPRLAAGGDLLLLPGDHALPAGEHVLGHDLRLWSAPVPLPFDKCFGRSP